MLVQLLVLSVDNLSGVMCCPGRGVRGLAVPQCVTQLTAVLAVSAAAGVLAGGCRVLQLRWQRSFLVVPSAILQITFSFRGVIL